MVGVGEKHAYHSVIIWQKIRSLGDEGLVCPGTSRVEKQKRVSVKYKRHDLYLWLLLKRPAGNNIVQVPGQPSLGTPRAQLHILRLEGYHPIASLQDR